MDEQAVNLRSPDRIIGRNMTLIGVMAVLGLLAGAIFAALCPPLQTGRFTASVTADPICLACAGTMIAPGAAGVNPVTVTRTAGTAARAEAAAVAAANRGVAQVQAASTQARQLSWQIVGSPAVAPATVPSREVLTDSLLVGAAGGVLLGIIAALASGWTSGDAPTVGSGLRATG